MECYTCGCNEPMWRKGMCLFHTNATYRLNHPNYAKEKSRSRKYGEIWRDVFARDGYKCVLCKSTERLSIDHIIPVLQGGKSTLENMRTLCLSCNSAGGKIPKTPYEKRKKQRAIYSKWKKKNPTYFREYKIMFDKLYLSVRGQGAR